MCWTKRLRIVLEVFAIATPTTPSFIVITRNLQRNRWNTSDTPLPIKVTLLLFSARIYLICKSNWAARNSAKKLQYKNVCAWMATLWVAPTAVSRLSHFMSKAATGMKKTNCNTRPWFKQPLSYCLLRLYLMSLNLYSMQSLSPWTIGAAKAIILAWARPSPMKLFVTSAYERLWWPSIARFMASTRFVSK